MLVRPQTGSQGRIRMKAIRRKAATVTPISRERRALVGVSVLEWLGQEESMVEIE
jgi:hypothetical protein